MNRVSTTILLALPLAALLAWHLGGTRGAGLLLGGVGGMAIAALGIAWQHHIARTQPTRMLEAFVQSFLAKLAILLMGGLAFRFIEPAAARVDHQSFLLSFAASAVLILFIGAPTVGQCLAASSAADGESTS